MKIDDLRQLGKRPFRTSDAASVGISKQLLYAYVKKGLVEKLGHGLYALPGNTGFDLIDYVKQALRVIPRAVVGFDTALQLQDLSEQSSFEIHLIVPTGKVPSRRIDDVVLHQVKPEVFDLGVAKVKGVRMTNLERTLVDLLRSGEPASTAMNVILTARNKGVPVRIPMLKKYGEKLRAKAKTLTLIEMLP